MLCSHSQDVKLLCPSELRDAGALLFIHMQHAFAGISFNAPSGPRRIRTGASKEAPGAPGNGLDAQGSGSSAPAQDAAEAFSARRTASGSLIPARRGTTDSVGGGAAAAPTAQQQQQQRQKQQKQLAADEDALLALLQQQNEASGLSNIRTARRRRPDADEVDSFVSGSMADTDDYGSTPLAGSNADADWDQIGGAGGSGGGQGRPEECLLEFEIEFVQVQVNLASDHAAGALVLGTNSALLLGHHYPGRGERSVTFKMDQVGGCKLRAIGSVKRAGVIARLLKQLCRDVSVCHSLPADTELSHPAFLALQSFWWL